MSGAVEDVANNLAAVTIDDSKAVVVYDADTAAANIADAILKESLIPQRKRRPGSELEKAKCSRSKIRKFFLGLLESFRYFLFVFLTCELSVCNLSAENFWLEVMLLCTFAYYGIWFRYVSYILHILFSGFNYEAFVIDLNVC